MSKMLRKVLALNTKTKKNVKMRLELMSRVLLFRSTFNFTLLNIREIKLIYKQTLIVMMMTTLMIIRSLKKKL